MGARTTALSALIACRKQGAWADGILKEYIRRDGLDRRDAALASRLCYGVLQNRMLLDHYISGCLTGSLNKLQPIVLDILRIGAYQLLMMDRIPVSAAVNEAVEQGKKYANRSASGLINAVLRRLDREKETLSPPDDLSVKYSHPPELVQLLSENIPDNYLEALLESHNQAPETVLQINSLRCDPAYAGALLTEEIPGLAPHPWLEYAFHFSGSGSVDHLPSFESGKVFVQDAAARLSVMAAEPRPGMQVLDMCSAPGGKSFAAAMMMQNQGRIISCDIHPHKLSLIDKGAQRLGIDIIETVLQDGCANRPDWNEQMDLVIADVPCSGLGVIRKKPDIRYKKLKQLEGLPAVQRRILFNAASYVKPGGVLLYSTCTILRRENEDIISDFLRENGHFAMESFCVPANFSHGENEGMLTLLPCIHGTDGFFICKLRRIS